jgi:hypothetical protein
VSSYLAVLYAGLVADDFAAEGSAIVRTETRLKVLGWEPQLERRADILKTSLGFRIAKGNDTAESDGHPARRRHANDNGV